MNYKTLFLLYLYLAFLSSCDSNSMDQAPEVTTYIIQVDEETFRVQINDTAVVAEAEQLLQSGVERNINGPLRAGDGVFNAPFSWHLDPDSVHFADTTIELCDGIPSMVEKDLDYWLNTVQVFCPWAVKVVGKD